MSARQQLIHYDGRVFVAAANSTSGEVSASTRFCYHQDGDVVWAEYSGGDIVKGFLLGRVSEDGCLTFHYQHLNGDKTLRIGKCASRPESLDDGRLRLFETWQWLDGERQTGTSVLDELLS